MGQCLRRNLRQASRKLGSTGFDLLSGLPLFQALAHAEDTAEPSGYCCRQTLSGGFVGLAEVLPALGMSDDDMGAAHSSEHGGRYLAGVGTGRGKVTVLGA